MWLKKCLENPKCLCNRNVVYQMHKELQQRHAVVTADDVVLLAVGIRFCLLIQIHLSGNRLVEDNGIGKGNLAVLIDISAQGDFYRIDRFRLL